MDHGSCVSNPSKTFWLIVLNISIFQQTHKLCLALIAFKILFMTLHQFWNQHGCLLMNPYDVETGAGTMNPMTVLRALGPEEWNVAYVEPSRRPTDGRYGENPNRLYQTPSISSVAQTISR